MHALNVIHYMHDKYAYERLEMALHDREILRTMACGIAGPVGRGRLAVGDQVRDASRRSATNRGLVVDYEIEGEFPAYGNDDDRVDAIAVALVERVHGQDPPAPDLPQRGARPSRC